MSLRRVLVPVAAWALFMMPASGWAGPAEEARVSYEKGNELLRKADLEGAQRAYAAAARADGSQSEYRTKYTALRQVLTLRESLGKEKNEQKWLQGARRLHDFYRQNGLHAEALPLNEELHRRLKNADSAVTLAGTLLVLEKAAEAEKILSGLEAGATPLSNSLLGIALARQDKKEAARSLLARIQVPPNAGPDLLYNLACIAALTGDKGAALGFLMRTLENTPITRQESVKTTARADRDLASISKAPEFSSVLLTLSKVKDPHCVGDQCVDPGQGGKGGEAVPDACSIGLLVVK